MAYDDISCIYHAAASCHAARMVQDFRTVQIVRPWLHPTKVTAANRNTAASVTAQSDGTADGARRMSASFFSSPGIMRRDLTLSPESYSSHGGVTATPGELQLHPPRQRQQLHPPPLPPPPRQQQHHDRHRHEYRHNPQHPFRQQQQQQQQQEGDAEPSEEAVPGLCPRGMSPGVFREPLGLKGSSHEREGELAGVRGSEAGREREPLQRATYGDYITNDTGPRASGLRPLMPRHAWDPGPPGPLPSAPSEPSEPPWVQCSPMPVAPNAGVRLSEVPEVPDSPASGTEACIASGRDSEQQQQPPAKSKHQLLLPLPAVDALNVPCLTAVFSTLPRLPEAFSVAGRRRVRHLVTTCLSTRVVLAATNGELDAAGAAIMAASLATLGPDLMDGDPRVRVARTDLLDALAAAALAACRLPLQLTGWRQDGAQHAGGHSDLQKRRRYGHSPRSYSSLLHALAKLGYRPDDVWLERYLVASTHWLRSFPPRDLAALAWALAVMQYRPGEVWLSELLAAWPAGRYTVEARSGGEGGGVDGASVGRARTGPDGSAALPRRRADGHSLSLLLWALWRLGVAAPPAWLDGAVEVCAVPSVPTSSFGSAATLRNHVGTVSQPSFAAATCQSLALVSYSLARMGHTPSARVRTALLAAAEPLLQQGSTQDLVLLLVGVAHWPRGGAATVVSERWLQQLCQALRPRLPGCSAQALVLSLSALAHLRYHPGEVWLREHEASLRPYIAGGGLDGRAAARVAAAWARLRFRPGRNIVDRLLKMLVTAATSGNLHGSGGVPERRRWLSARLFADGLYGIAVLVAARRTATNVEHQPPKQPPPAAPLLAAIHVRALLTASQSRLPYSYLDEALLHLHAWRLLRVSPPHQWQANLTAVARAKLHATPPKVLVDLLQLLAWPGWRGLRQNAPPPPPPQSSQLNGYCRERPDEPDSHPGQCAEFAGGCSSSGDGGGGDGGSFSLPVSAALVGAIMERLTAAALSELSVRQLADLATATAALRVRPTRAWLRLFLQALQTQIRYGSEAPGLDPGFNPNQDPNADLEGFDLYPEGLMHPMLRDGGAGGDWGAPGARDFPEGTAADLPPPPPPPPPYLRALRAAAHLAAAVGDQELQRLAAELLSTAGYGSYEAAAPQHSTPSSDSADGGAGGAAVVVGCDGRRPAAKLLRQRRVLIRGCTSVASEAPLTTQLDVVVGAGGRPAADDDRGAAGREGPPTGTVEATATAGLPWHQGDPHIGEVEEEIGPEAPEAVLARVAKVA
ncbi:hypothetical protein VOLCADRAFT_98041 [Volvox carteri f. nagariensis]|uniref:RAP domain-containing protein n=1 Tax=Volvox carteri f. nagariensis TaxID=3068 RepID=D8UEA4_VOLCA|nr:uncharacterized protein VOLCADRAFT_98041 [Volvox carteri f. nagariensis]EFJ41935.1 hypothetical protein VOLCADRAFT_98041 [Volvox carteri f. nagariensis]|eukprot:XP_002956972.1 hypothetical protein VOLCADRAFT_98041 [Volvox carteri f. nagariensis]